MRGSPCTCSVETELHICGLMADGKGYVEMVKYANLLHLPYCSGASRCSCTQTLFERGRYRLRCEVYGEHLHRCCVDDPKPPCVDVEYEYVLLEQYRWPKLIPYDFEHLEPFWLHLLGLYIASHNDGVVTKNDEESKSKLFKSSLSEPAFAFLLKRK